LFSKFLTSTDIFDVAALVIVVGTAVTLMELGSLEMLMDDDLITLGVTLVMAAWMVAVPDIPPA